MLAFFALTGVVVNDSIVLVSFFKRMHDEGMAFRDALEHAALARLRAIGTADDSIIRQFRLLARRAAKNADEWQVADERQMAKIERLRDDFTWIVARADELDTADAMPWDSFYREAEATLSLEGQEALVSLMMEPYGEIVDPLAACMHADEELAHRIDGKATVADTIAAIDAKYDWTGSIDFEATRFNVKERRAFKIRGKNTPAILGAELVHKELHIIPPESRERLLRFHQQAGSKALGNF